MCVFFLFACFLVCLLQSRARLAPHKNSRIFRKFQKNLQNFRGNFKNFEIKLCGGKRVCLRKFPSPPKPKMGEKLQLSQFYPGGIQIFPPPPKTKPNFFPPKF